MNNLASTIQAIYTSLMFILPGVLWLIVNSIIIFLAVLFGKHHADSVWKNNIKLHMPKVTKEEIEKRDSLIIKLKRQNKKYKLELDRLNNHVNAIKGIADSMKEKNA